MSSTVINRRRIILHDVSAQIQEKSIAGLIRKYLPGIEPEINCGDTCYKNTKRVYRRIFVRLDKPTSVDTLMSHRLALRLDGELLKVTRNIPKLYPFHDQCVTGLKIAIRQATSGNTSVAKLNERDLKKYFQHYGKIHSCAWTNQDHTEALFTFADYDSVDQIILDNPSPEIKGMKVDLEKSRTPDDYVAYEGSYVVHVTNLPVRVTSEELSHVFEVPITYILLHPCLRIEQSHVVGGRSSSEAWIRSINDRKTAQALAEKKKGLFVRTNKIQCEALPEPINEEELCERFQTDECPYPVEKCYYKHITCSEPDTCDDEYCWLGHTNKRTTKPVRKPIYRSEDARYRVRIGNLPANITHDSLMTRLKIAPNYSRQLVLQTSEGNSNSPRMAYLIRQPLENKLRQQIDKWHNMPFSPLMNQTIQYQLEINQDLFDWNDSVDVPPSRENSRCASPIPSTHSVRSNRSKEMAYYPSAASTYGWTPVVSKKSSASRQAQTRKPAPTPSSNASKKPSMANNAKLKSLLGTRKPPEDLSSLSIPYHWTNQMILNDPTDRDELYKLESESNHEKNIVIKIYASKIDRTARLHAQHEQSALEQLTGCQYVPKLLHSNVNLSTNNAPKKELWTIMKLIDGERLSDYMKSNTVTLAEALQITHKLLNMIRQMHARNVIHRDIQPRNVLVDQRCSIMLINFSSASVIDDRQAQIIDDLSDQLGNSFYRLPQFEKRSDETDQNEDQQQLCRSPTIDTTGICAILFWMITGREPKESQDIWGHAPHRLRDNSKIIEKKIMDGTAFQMEMKIHEHLYRHLMFTFDRSFAGPNRQWSVTELDYQLQFMLALIDGDRKESNVFPPLLTNMPSLTIPLGDPFIHVVSLIHHLKDQFAVRYSKCVHWANEEKNRWRSEDGKIEHDDLLIFSHQTKHLSMNIHWNVRLMFREQQFEMGIQAKTKDNIDIELPLGLWKVNEQGNDFVGHLRNFEMEMKILIDILYQSIAA